ncbi:hypothetical protein EPO33_00370 [Patescibacteria group bacterium]|nr:MAG: hypothetical protein EPO33_00370 [Patescibacteria group bacterium]
METSRKFEMEQTPPWVAEGLAKVARWLEADAVTYDRASDAEAAEQKREHAEAIIGLAKGNGSDDLRKQAIEFLKASRVPNWENIIEYLKGMDFHE